MTKHVIAAELQSILEKLQALAISGERLAASSGLVSPSPFRAIQTSITVAAGELDQKGMLDRKQPVSEDQA